MTLKDIGIYKNRLISTIINSPGISECLLGGIYDEDEANDRLLYKQVFPYLYVNNTQTETLSYVCMEVNVPSISDFTYKNMRVVIWCYSHKDIMKYSKQGYLGTRADVLSDMIDRLLNSSKNFGIGRLKLESCTYFMPGNDYYGKQLVYSCSEFNIDEKL